MGEFVFISKSVANRGVPLALIKVGDSLWDIYCGSPREGKVVYLGYDGKKFEIYVRFGMGDRYVTKIIGVKQINKTFFLTEEDAFEAMYDD